ncbi:kinase-like domain-containing protein, partial [Pavlovales sp. CCMP2436]
MGAAVDGARRLTEPAIHARGPHARRPGASIQDTYHMGKLIGKGAFSSVFRARHLETRRAVAIKVAFQRPHVVSEAQAEANLMRGLHHPNVVELIDLIWTGETDVYLVQELVDGGSLADYLHDLLPGRVPAREVRRLTRQLFCGLEYLHSQNIIHRDIKPANLLLHLDGTGGHALKISDFGLSTLGADEAARRTLCGTPEFLAPEIIRVAAPRERGGSRHMYSSPSDMWSSGCVIYTMLYNRPPFRAESLQQLFSVILAAKADFDERATARVAGMYARDLVMHLLVVAPEARYSASDALTHPWLD